MINDKTEYDKWQNGEILLAKSRSLETLQEKWPVYLINKTVLRERRMVERGERERHHGSNSFLNVQKCPVYIKLGNQDIKL